MVRMLLATMTAAFVVSVQLLVPPGARADTADVGHVVLIDIDGFDPSYLRRVDMPNLRELIKRGNLSIAGGTFRPISNPNRTSLATGAYPATHLNDAYVLDPERNVITGQTRATAVENVGQALVRQGRTLASAGWYILENQGVEYGNPEALYTQHDCLTNFDSASKIIRREPVDSGGTDVVVPKVPDYLAIYCADIDAIGHRVGPDHPDIDEMLERIDAGIGDVVAATKDAGVHDDTTFVVLSDHGMTGFSKSIHDKVLDRLDKAGYRAEIIASGGAPAEDTEVVLAQVARSAAVYLRGRAASPLHRLRLHKLFRRMPEIDNVLGRAALRRLRAAPREGDFTLETREPYSFSPAEPEPGAEFGTHSTLEEMRLPLVFAGRGIRKDARPRRPRSIDVIPTVSRLLGVEPPAAAEGRVLREILGSDAP